MAQAFSLLIQEEKQREFKLVGQMTMKSTTFNVNTFNNKIPMGKIFRKIFFQQHIRNTTIIHVLITTTLKTIAIQKEIIVGMAFIVTSIRGMNTPRINAINCMAIPKPILITTIRTTQ